MCAGELAQDPLLTQYPESNSRERVIANDEPGCFVVGMAGVSLAAESIIAGDREPADGRMLGDRAAAAGDVPGDCQSASRPPADGSAACGIDTGASPPIPRTPSPRPPKATRPIAKPPKLKTPKARPPSAINPRAVGPIANKMPRASSPIAIQPRATRRPLSGLDEPEGFRSCGGIGALRLMSKRGSPRSFEPLW